MWSTESESNFTELTGKITYTGKGSRFSVIDGNYTLNGIKMELGKDYYLTDGDIIKNLDFKPLTSADLKWNFRDS